MTHIVFIIKDHDSPIIAAVSMQSRTDTQIHVCRLGDALKSSARPHYENEVEVYIMY